MLRQQQQSKQLQWVIFTVLAALVLWFGPGLASSFSPDASEQAPAASSQPGDGRKVAFIAVGDTGSGTSHQKKVAAQLTQASADFPVKPFPLLILGDVVYPVGNYEEFGNERVEAMYSAAVANGAELRPVMGNHDAITEDGAQYLKFFQQPPYYHFTFGPVDFYGIDTNQTHLTQSQLDWLDASLAKSSQPWTVVYGHHPLYTSGGHQGDAELAILREKLEPVLLKHHVDMYLAGHDHNYERFALQNGHLLKLVSGGGGAYLRPIKSTLAPGSEKALSVYHFLEIHADDDAVLVKAIGEAGNQLDCVVLKQSANATIEAPTGCAVEVQAVEAE